MYKKILSVFLAFIILATTFLSVSFNINADATAGDIIEFNSESDILQKSNEVELITDGTVTAVKLPASKNGVSVCLPTSLKNNTDYDYTIKYRGVGSVDKTYLAVQAGGSKQMETSPKNLVNVFGWVNVNPSDDYQTVKGSFTTTDLGDKNNVYIRIKGTDGCLNIYIDSIIITPKSDNIYPFKGTLTFRDDASVVYKTNDVSIISDNGTTVLNLGKNTAGVSVGLPISLKPNVEYSYTVKYRAVGESDKIFLQLQSGNSKKLDTSAKQLCNLVAWDNITPNSDYSNFSGKIKTDSDKVYDNNNLLYLRFKGTNAKLSIYIESITLEADISDEYPGEGTITFNNSDSIVYKSPKAVLANDNGTAVLKLGKNTDGVSVGLPIMLKPNTEYSYEIKYRGVGEGDKMFVQLQSGKGSALDTAGKALTNVLTWEEVTPSEQYEKIKGSFKTTDETVFAGNNLLYIRLKGTNGKLDINIESVTVKVKTGDENVYPGEGTITFNNSDSIVYKSPKAVLANDNGTAVLKLGKNTDGVSVGLPITLKQNTEYSYEIKYRGVGESDKMFVQLQSGKGSALDTAGKALTNVLAWEEVTPSEQYEQIKGSFKTTDETVFAGNNLLYIRSKGTNGKLDINIESVTVKVKTGDEDIYPGEGTITFNNSDSIVYKSPKAVLENDNGTAVLKLGKNTDGVSVGLPITLKQNTIYTYSIKYRAVGTEDKVYLALQSGKASSLDTAAKNIGLAMAWTVISPSDAYAVTQGILETSGDTVFLGNNLLYMRMKGTSGSLDIYIESVTIIEGDHRKSIEASETGTIIFDNSNKLVGVDGGASIKSDNGKNALYIPASSAGTSIRLPIKLKQGQKYSATVSYRVASNEFSKSNQGKSYMAFNSGNGTADKGFIKNDKAHTIAILINWNVLSATDSYKKMYSTFTVTETNVDEENSYLCLRYKGDANIFIDSITVEYDQLGKYTPIKTGTLDFETRNQLDKTTNFNCAIDDDNGRGVLHFRNNTTGVSARLPIILENNTKLTYELTIRVVQHDISVQNEGKSYMAFIAGKGNVDDDSFLDVSKAALARPYPWSYCETSDGYIKVKGLMRIRNVSSSENYLCIRYKGDAELFIDDITIQYAPDTKYGNPIDSYTWNLPTEDTKLFEFGKKWITEKDIEVFNTASKNTKAEDDKMSNDTLLKKNTEYYIIIGSVAAVVLGAITVVLIIKKRRKILK